MPSNSSGGRRKRSALTSRFVVADRQSDAEMLSASIEERAECATCSGRGVWMDEPCVDCAPFYCYPCARGDHDEHKVAWVPDVACECPVCVTPPA